jgi:hypothetical protein
MAPAHLPSPPHPFRPDGQHPNLCGAPDENPLNLMCGRPARDHTPPPDDKERRAPMHTDQPTGSPLDLFVDRIRSVLRLRDTSPVTEPTATESWSGGAGYTWTWTYGHGPYRGQWIVRAGAPLDPAPVLTCPAGVWHFDRADPAEADKLLMLLRLAGGLPDFPGRTGHAPAGASVSGGYRYPQGPPQADRVRIFDAPPGPDIPHPGGTRPLRPGPRLRAVLLREGDRYPAELPPGHAVLILRGGPDEHGAQAVLMPDLITLQYFNPADRSVLHWQDGEGRVNSVQIEPYQEPGVIIMRPLEALDDQLDPVIEAARRAEAAAGVLPDALQPVEKHGHFRYLPTAETTPESRAAGRARVLAELSVPDDLVDRVDQAVAAPVPEPLRAAGGTGGGPGPVDHVTRHADDTTPPPPAHHPGGGCTSSGDTW